MQRASAICIGSVTNAREPIIEAIKGNLDGWCIVALPGREGRQNYFQDIAFTLDEFVQLPHDWQA